MASIRTLTATLFRQPETICICSAVKLLSLHGHRSIRTTAISLTSSTKTATLLPTLTARRSFFRLRRPTTRAKKFRPLTKTVTRSMSASFARPAPFSLGMQAATICTPTPTKTVTSRPMLLSMISSRSTPSEPVLPLRPTPFPLSTTKPPLRIGHGAWTT